MWRRNDIVKQIGKEVILVKEIKQKRYYKAEIDDTMFRIRNVTPVNRQQAYKYFGIT